MGLPSRTKIEDSRDRIDQLDHEFIRLIAERMRVVREIGNFKADNPDSPLRDEERERELLSVWAKAAAEEGLSTYFVGRVLREVLNYSRRDQERFLRPEGEKTAGVRVAYQGVPACYSDLTITKYFAGRSEEHIGRLGFHTFPEAFDALDSGDVDYAFLPIENTIAGSINEVYDLLARRSATIVGEEVWPVEHCLVGLPGTEISDVRLIRSHPVALQQCQKFLDGLVACKAESYHDTAGAAQAVAAEGDASIAAIASEEAAEHYGLNVLRRGISDQRVNLTRFLLIGKEPEPFDPRQPSKTSLMFSVNHRHGALLRCLQAFDEEDINLTKLESRPQPNSPWEYLFYVDIEGHEDDVHVADALSELRRNTNHLKVLGSYPCRTSEQSDAMKAVLEASGVQGQLASEETARIEPAPIVTLVERTKKSERPPHYAPREDGKTQPVTCGNVEVGGERFVLISGPCAVESRDQIFRSAEMIKSFGATIMRGGAFKPRSSPYSFQGMGFEGLELLAEAGAAFELPICTEVLRAEDVGKIAERADMLQVGARNMQNFALLRELGHIDRPILLKRGMSATIKEFLMAAEYIMAGGNNRVILCERGIRTFETTTRATLDVAAVPVLRRLTHLPVIIDPSHAAGVRHLVVPLALSGAAAGADGLIVEAHPDPESAKCDKEQALTEVELGELLRGLKPIVAAYGRKF